MKYVKTYEGFSFDDTFTTIVKANEVDIRDYNLPNEDSYIDSDDMSIEWFLDTELRRTGVNTILPTITRVSGSFTITTPSDDGNDAESQVNFDQKHTDDWIFETEGEIKFGSGIYPQSIEIIFNEKKIIVSF